MPPPTPPPAPLHGSPFAYVYDNFMKTCEMDGNNNNINVQPCSDGGLIWNTMSDDEKTRYVQKSKRLWKDYFNATDLYSNKLLEDNKEILANMKNTFSDPVTTPSTTHLDNKNELGSKSNSEKQHHVEANENELGSKADSEKQHHVEANENELGLKEDSEKQLHVEANENELGSKSDSEKQHHVEANENELGSKSDSEKQNHVEANENELGSKSDSEKQLHVEANENELGSKSDSEKQHHVEANENELGSKSDSEKQHHDEAPFDIPAHHKTSCALARNILQAYSFQSAEEIGNYFLDNRGKIITMVNQLI